MTVEAAVSLGELLRRLEQAGLSRPAAESQNLPPLTKYLRAWQSVRLTDTYPDLLAGSEYGPAGRFFLTDLYAPLDFSQRDDEIRRAGDFLRKTLPESMIRGLLKAIELNELSSALDGRLGQVLKRELGIVDSFTRKEYEQAYRLCDNYSDRVHQIDLIIQCGRMLEASHRMPLTGGALRVVRLPARIIGWGRLHDFLQRGYDAWSPVRDHEYFLRTIESREKTLLNQIYGVPE